jgi:hypothetical protein
MLFLKRDLCMRTARVYCCALLCRNRIHEHTISLRFLGIILRVLRLEVSKYNVYITNQFQVTFAQGGGRGESKFRL